ncbi:MAG: glycosyltransferase family 4 protein [Terriglobales bacterium]
MDSRPLPELVIDARCLASGIGTYGHNVLTRLSSSGLSERTRLIVGRSMQASMKNLFADVAVSNAPVYSIREQLSIPRFAATGTLFHAFHYNAPLLHRGPLLVTIHDVTHILDDHYRNDWRSRVYSRPMLLAAARRSEIIFTGSEYVRECIIEHLGVPESKIVMSSYGVGEEFAPGDVTSARATVKRCTGSAASYVLFVGNLKPHKNVANLLRAFAELTNQLKFTHRLILIGDDRIGRSAVTAQIQQLKLQSRVQLIALLALAELIDFYRAADLVVLPSFQEGFGLPVAEAMACGTPVACSRAASLPEVGGEAAEYFDPHRPEDIAQTIVSVLHSSDKRTRMSEAGRVQARRFTWERTFQEHMRIYQSFLSGASAMAAD